MVKDWNENAVSNGRGDHTIITPVVQVNHFGQETVKCIGAAKYNDSAVANKPNPVMNSSSTFPH